MKNKLNDENEIFVCRCEEITVDEVRKAVREGAVTVDAVKRATRAGKGLCQSKTCFIGIARIISEETGIPVSDIVPMRISIPVRPVKISTISE